MFGNLAESLATDLSSLGDGGDLVAKSCPTLATPWTIVLQVPLNVGFSIPMSFSSLLLAVKMYVCVCGRMCMFVCGV